MAKYFCIALFFMIYGATNAQELIFDVKTEPPYFELTDFSIDIFLKNNTKDTLVFFDSRGPSYNSFREEWYLDANSRFMDILPLNGFFEHKFSDSLFIKLLPDEKKLIRSKTFKLDLAGDYSFTYTYKQSPTFIDKEWADSTVTDSLIKTINSFNISENIKFDVFINFDTVIHDTINMAWQEWKDFRHVKLYSAQNHFDNLEAAFNYPQDVYSLKLYCDNVSENQIKQIGSLCNLRKLELRNYTLNYYPKELTNLDLYELTLIPKEEKNISFRCGITKNKTLRELTAKFYDSIPKDVINHEELMLLNISNCNLKNLPDLEPLKNLKKLVANNNNLSNLASLNLGSLPKLIDLNLSGNKQITSFEQILKCKNLEFLTINRVTIDSVPDGIKNLHKLKQLEIGNKLVFISDSVGNLSDLRILSLGGNRKLNHLPQSIINLTKLRQLNINLTAITELPSGILALPLNKLQLHSTPIKKSKDYFLLKYKLGDGFKD